MKPIYLFRLAAMLFFLNGSNLSNLQAQLLNLGLLNEPVDISADFQEIKNTYHVADSLVSFNPDSIQGRVRYSMYRFTTRMAFNRLMGDFRHVNPRDIPFFSYDHTPALPFTIEFISSRTLRVRVKTTGVDIPDRASLMLVNQDLPRSKEWLYSRVKNGHKYSSPHGSVIISENPWKITFLDAKGNLLTSTYHPVDNQSTFTPNMPFGWARTASNYDVRFSAAFGLQPGEKIFGYGEQFTEFNKRGQKIHLYTADAHGTQNETSHKPIPFFMSNKGYGMFIHSSAPITCDVGKYFSGIHSLYIGDEELDLFVFLGQPKDILNEYTSITGKPQMPPLWSFGFWMSRITYFSEAEGRAVAKKLRDNKIPCDVIHFDTGWFEDDWRCDYKFSSSRFTDPGKMISDLKKDGFHVSLWQLPYFSPTNRLFPEIIENGLHVKNEKGTIPYEDAIPT